MTLHKDKEVLVLFEPGANGDVFSNTIEHAAEVRAGTGSRFLFFYKGSFILSLKESWDGEVTCDVIRGDVTPHLCPSQLLNDAKYQIHELPRLFFFSWMRTTVVCVNRTVCRWASAQTTAPWVYQIGRSSALQINCLSIWSLVLWCPRDDVLVC